MPLFAGEVDGGADEDAAADHLRDGVTELGGAADVEQSHADEVEGFFGANVFAQGFKKICHIYMSQPRDRSAYFSWAPSLLGAKVAEYRMGVRVCAGGLTLFGKFDTPRRNVGRRIKPPDWENKKARQSLV